jgi:PAS domain S-box-containing protein
MCSQKNNQYSTTVKKQPLTAYANPNAYIALLEEENRLLKTSLQKWYTQQPFAKQELTGLEEPATCEWEFNFLQRSFTAGANFLQHFNWPQGQNFTVKNLARVCTAATLSQLIKAIAVAVQQRAMLHETITLHTPAGISLTVVVSGSIAFKNNQPIQLAGTLQWTEVAMPPEDKPSFTNIAYYHAFKDSGSAMALLNAQLEITDANLLFCELMGIDETDVLNKNLPGLLTAISEANESDDISLLESGNIRTLQNTYRRLKNDGTSCLLQVHIAAVEEHSNVPQIYICKISNSSSNAIQQEELQKKEQMYRALFDRNPAGVFSLDKNGNITSVNDVMLGYIGVPRHLILGAPIISLVLPVSLEKAALKLALALQGQTQETLVEVQIANGETLSVVISLLPIIVNEIQTGIFGIVNDVTQSLQNRRALQKSEDNLRSIFDHAVAGYILCNEDMTIAYYNQPAEAFIQQEFNIQLQEGMNCNSCVEKAAGHPFVALVQEGRYGRSAALTYETAAGTALKKQWYYIRCNPVQTQEQQTNGFLIQIENTTQQKNAENQLLHERNQLQTLINNIPDAIYVKDNMGRKLVTNKLDLSLMDAGSEREVLGKTDLEIFPDNMGRQGYEDDMMIVQTGQPLVNQTQKLRTRDGKTISLLTTKIPLKNENNKVTGLMGIGRDITSYIQALEEVRKSNERFEYVTQATFDAVWDWDVETGVVYRGEGYQTIFGYKKGMLNSTCENWELLIHEDDRARVLEKFVLAMAGKDTRWQDEYRFLKPGGEYAYVVDKGIIIRDETGKCVRMIGAMQDITTRKLEEEQLRVYEMAVKNTTEAVLITNANVEEYNGYKILYVNDAFLKHTGYTKEEVIGRSPQILQGEKTCRNTLQKMKESFEKWQPVNVELLNYKKNREEYWAQLSIAPVADEKGWFTHWVAVQSDITAAKQSQLDDSVYYQVSSAINNASGLEEALQASIELLCKHHQFAAAEAWSVSFDKTKILYKGQVGNVAAPTSAALSPGIFAFKKGEGLPGTAFETGEIVCWQNLQQSYFLRKALAEENNWTCGLAVPVLYDQEVIAVLVFYGEQPFTQRQKNSRLLQKVQYELGTALQKVLTENELNSFFELSPDLLSVICKDGNYRKINAAFERTLGYKEAVFLEKNSADFVHPLDRERYQKELQYLLQGGTPRYFETKMLTQAGGTCWLGWSFTTIIEESLIFAVAKDITYHKKLEAEKHNILESITDYFYALDNECNFTFLNSAAQALLAPGCESLKGKNLWEQFPVLRQGEFYKQVQYVLQHRKPVIFEYYSDLVNCWFEESIYPGDDGLSVFFRSVNERKETEHTLNELNKNLAKKAEELATSNGELERFAYVASHDLQEPLRMISGFMQLLQKKYEPLLDDDGKKYVHFAIDGAVRMKTLIQELLNYSKAGNLETTLEPVDMGEVMADVKMILKTSITNSGAKISHTALPVVNANITMVTQLMQNLIGNGIKYQLPGNKPVIEVAAVRQPTCWEFSVQDNGIGIAAEHEHKVFEVFHRLHTKQQYAGTGIGLSICKKIVEKLGGNIWLTSKEGQGSNFHFTIPL